MSNYDQTQVAYPPPNTAYPPETHGYVTPPPPAGYPTKDGSVDQPRNPPPNNTTKSRGEGLLDFSTGCRLHAVSSPPRFLRSLPTCPPPSTAYPVETHGYVAPPPPAGYPTKDGSEVQPGNPSPTNTTKSRGDGFWKGCCAALCCCCALDACF